MGWVSADGCESSQGRAGAERAGERRGVHGVFACAHGLLEPPEVVCATCACRRHDAARVSQTVSSWCSRHTAPALPKQCAPEEKRKLAWVSECTRECTEPNARIRARIPLSVTLFTPAAQAADACQVRLPSLRPHRKIVLVHRARDYPLLGP